MKSGFIRPLGNGGICWVNEKTEWDVPRSDEAFLQLGKAPWMKAENIPAFNCDVCKRIIIDYGSGKR